MDIIKTGTLC